MNYHQLVDHLFSNANQKYADFSKSLSNSDYQVIGIRIPLLREIVKEHKNDDDLLPIDFKLGQYLEIDFIYFGLSLSRLKTIDDQLAFLKTNIKKAKSWVITDTISPYLKKCPFEKYWDLYLALYQSKHTYDRRFAYVLGLKQYRDERILQVLPKLTLNEEYMVMMAEAWLLSTVAITYQDQIFDYLKTCRDLTLKRKTISKIYDSFRFDEHSKNRFKSLR